MALKTIMLRRSIELKKQELEALREKDQELQNREAELETAIAEAETEEQQKTVSEEIDAFEADKTAHDAERTALEGEIEELEKQLEEEERKAPVLQKPEKTERRENTMTTINIRALPKNQRAFEALPMEQRSAILEQEDVKAFLAQLRSYKGQSRAITGGELTIPVVFLDLIAEDMYRYSKLMNRVRVRNVAGTARQTIAGVVPEAVWTEMCAAINELTFAFNQVTLDGYKVAGYIPVCNALLEDSDVALASWVMEMLAESIGLAKDKAILYGKGAASKMPLGIVTRLAQQSKPSDYPAAAPAWTDLHESNIKVLDASLSGASFWSALQLAAGAAYTRYSRGEQFWAMNSRTYALLKSKAITFTASGDVVANVYGVLPIVTGDIDVLEFIPDGDIIGGYGDLYLWAQRSGMTIEASTEVQFIQDNTVFRGKERADGMPVIPGAFVAINIAGHNVTTAMDFATDTANEADLSALTIGSLSLSPSFDGAVLAYTASATNATAKAAVTATPANGEAGISITITSGTTTKVVTNGAEAALAVGENTIAVTVRNGNAAKVYTVVVTRAAS